MIAAAVLGLSLIVATGPAATPQQQDSGKKVGQQLDELGRTIKKGLQNAGETVREKFAKARAAVHDMDLASRVYGRLHWEKCLNSSTLDLEVKDDVVTLRGTVPDPKARMKAVELARDTVGINEVVDHLTIAASLGTGPASSSGSVPRR